MSLYAREDFREGLGVETSDGARGKIGHGGSVSGVLVWFVFRPLLPCPVPSPSTHSSSCRPLGSQ